MTTEQSVLLKLIHQSQFDTIEDIAWDDIDLDALYEEANQQAVLGLIAPLIPAEYSNDTWRKAQFQQEVPNTTISFQPLLLKPSPLTPSPKRNSRGFTAAVTLYFISYY